MTDRNLDADLKEALEAAEAESREESAVQSDEQTEAVETQQEQEAPEATEIPEDLQPVSAWDEEARNAWMSIAGNAEYHDSLRPIVGQFQSDYKYRTQLEQERADLQQRASVAEQFDQITQRFGDVFQGRNPMDVIGNYLYYGQQLTRDPQGTIKQLASQYGVDLGQMVQDEPYIDETTKQLMERYQALEQQIHNQQAQAQQQQAMQVVETAKAFEFETDAEGNLRHPHVPKVAEHMLHLMQSGQAQDWKSAYDTACWMNPEVREILLKEQGQSKKLQQQEQATRAKAAASAQPKSGKSAKSQPKGVEDLDDAIGKAMAEAASA